MNKLKKFLSLSYFEKKYFLECFYYSLKTRFFYSYIFGRVGKGGWIKLPDQVFNAKKIYIGDNVRIERYSVLYSVQKYGNKNYGGEINISNGVYANKGFNITSACKVTVGEGTAFGPNVFICDFDHGFSSIHENMIESSLNIKGEIIIGRNSWLGANVFVSGGVELGEHCVVAANSVVTKSFPAYSVIAGVPAKLIKQYNFEKEEWIKA